MRYELARPEQYTAAKEDAPIAYIAWGAHEWHGLHNPLGLDTLKAHGICLALCEETGGVVFPPIYCGHQTMKPYAGFKATIEHSRECVQLLARNTLEQLRDEGFRVVVLVMGHYGPRHVEALNEVVEEFNARQSDTVVWAFPDYTPIKSEGFRGDHAGQTETSYLMYFHPDLVDLSRLPKDGELDMFKDGVDGVDPRSEASSEFGRQVLDALVRNAVPKIVEMLKASARKASPEA